MQNASSFRGKRNVITLMTSHSVNSYNPAYLQHDILVKYVTVPIDQILS